MTGRSRNRRTGQDRAGPGLGEHGSEPGEHVASLTRVPPTSSLKGVPPDSGSSLASSSGTRFYDAAENGCGARWLPWNWCARVRVK